VSTGFFDLDKDLEAALLALLASDAILDLDLDFVEALEVTGDNELVFVGTNDGDSGGVGGEVLSLTNSNDRITHLEGSSERLPQIPVESKPEEQSISNKCCSAGPSFWSVLAGKLTSYPRPEKMSLFLINSVDTPSFKWRICSAFNPAIGGIT